MKGASGRMQTKDLGEVEENVFHLQNPLAPPSSSYCPLADRFQPSVRANWPPASGPLKRVFPECGSSGHLHKVEFGLSCDRSGVKFGLSCDRSGVKFGLSCDRSGVKFGLSCDRSGVKFGLSCDRSGVKFGLSCDRSGVKFGLSCDP
jgi:hypothetical protein